MLQTIGLPFRSKVVMLPLYGWLSGFLMLAEMDRTDNRTIGI